MQLKTYISIFLFSSAICFHSFSQEKSAPFHKIKVNEGFSPNGDAWNNTITFKPEIWYNEKNIVNTITVLSIEIRNTKNEIVFSGDAKNSKWDGQSNGTPCPNDSYYWTVTYKNSSENQIIEQGMLLLIR